MAHSIQSRGDKTKIFNDGDLSVLILLFDQEVSEYPDQYPAIRRIIDFWKQELPSCGPGLIDLRLENIAVSTEVRREFTTLLHAVSKTFDRFGDKIPGAYLSKINNAPDVNYFDYETSRGIGVMSEFRDLLFD